MENENNFNTDEQFDLPKSNREYTQASDISALKKFLGHIKEVQEEHTELEKESLDLENTDKNIELENKSINIEDDKKIELENDSINIEDDSKSSLKNESINIVDDKTISKLNNTTSFTINNKKIERLSNSKLEIISDSKNNKLDNDSIKLEDKNNQLSLEDTNIKLNNTNNINSLDDKKETIDTSSSNIDSLSKKSVSINDNKSISNLPKDNLLKLENNNNLGLSSDKIELENNSIIKGISNNKVEIKSESSIDKLLNSFITTKDNTESKLSSSVETITDNTNIKLSNSNILLSNENSISELNNSSIKIPNDSNDYIFNSSDYKREYIKQSDIDIDKLNGTQHIGKILLPFMDESGMTLDGSKDYSGYGAGIKYLLSLEGYDIKLTENDRKEISSIKNYLGLSSDKESATYSATSEILDRTGTWGKKFSAYLTSILSKNSNFKTYIPQGDIKNLFSISEAGLNFTATDNIDKQKSNGIQNIEVNSLSDDILYSNINYDSDNRINNNPDKNLYHEIKKDTILDHIKIQRTKDNNQYYEKLNIGEDSNSNITKLNDKVEGMPSYKLPEVSLLDSGFDSTKYIRYGVEKLLNSYKSDKVLDKITTKQELLDTALATAIKARDLLEKTMKIEKSRLPGTGNDLLADTITLAKNGLNSNSFKSSVIGKASTLFTEKNGIKNVPKKDGVYFKDLSEKGNYLTHTFDKGDKKIVEDNIGLEITRELLDANNTNIETTKDWYNALINSRNITTPNIFSSFNNKGKVQTLDSNHIWEIILEPYVGIENGYISYLPAYREINEDNYIRHGYRTTWDEWVPITSYEMNSKKLSQKNLSLFDGEISYPSSIEFTNELRLTICDDQYKSWKSYFEKVMYTMVYMSNPHRETIVGTEHVKNTTTFESKVIKITKSYLDENPNIKKRYKKEGWLYYYEGKLKKIVEKYLSSLEEDEDNIIIEKDFSSFVLDYISKDNEKWTFIDDIEINGELISDDFIEKINKEEYTPDNNDIITVSLIDKNKQYLTVDDVDKSKTVSETKYTTYEKSTTFYKSTDTDKGSTKIIEGDIYPAPYKNVTFRCKIYSMTPQFSTIRKFDLLIVLKDYQEEFSGDTDAGPTDLSLNFSIVGENPLGKIAESYTSPIVSETSENFKYNSDNLVTVSQDEYLLSEKKDQVISEIKKV